ncbi:ABC transporter permease subunit [Arsenicicoccus dermatophilus]|uniref:ABC transporter permease subunit n=1 Tax=Arsenicicoccus dermatophilus TaxID=1076331 RepID=UPI001F4D2951|nr:ABC transporter permease subunit [Arsenicicoccus dermatophilus]
MGAHPVGRGVRRAGRGAALLLALRPLAVLVGSVAAVVLLAGCLPWLSGQDPAQTVLRARQVERVADPAALAAVRQELDLAGDPVTGALRWGARALRGDLGTSWVGGGPVAPAALRALGVSLTLAGLSALAALAIALVLVTPRILAAGSGDRRRRDVLTTVVASLAALPEAVVAVLLVVVVSLHLHLLPATGWTTAAHLVLPVATLAVCAVGVLTRVLALAVDDVAAEAWTRTWQANGARPLRTSLAVAHRAVAVVLPQVLLLLAGLVGAAVVVEDTFAIPGLGRLALNAALSQDIPMVQACAVVLVVTGLAVGAAGVLCHRAMTGPALGAGRGVVSGPRPEGRGRLGIAWWLAAGALLVLVLGGMTRQAAIEPAARHLRPSWAHPLGTDHVGRDVWARVGHGAVETIGLAVVLSAACLVVGLLVGLRSSGRGAGVTDVLNAVPSVFMGIVVAAVAGPGLPSACVAVCLVGWIPLAVHTRTLATEARASGFHQAALVAGAGRWWILRTHLLPVVLRPVLGHAVIRVPHLALALTGLSYLGLGAGHDSPEWGKLLADSVAHAERAPWVVAAPALGLVLLGLVATLALTPSRSVGPAGR